MSAAFKVGEVCIGQNFVNSPELNGLECVIIGGLVERLSKHLITGLITSGFRYRVQFADGSIFAQEPYFLRLKQPPTSAKSIMRAAILKAKQPSKVPA